MARTGRPRKEINQKLFENLCGIQCTEAEICAALECSEDTINRWCKRTYGATFADTYKSKSQMGKSSLRRMQFKLAEKSATMAIWLGKQYLGQKDQVEASVAVDTAKEDALSKSLREMAEELESDE